MSPVVTKSKKLIGSMEPIVIRKTRLKRMINGSEWRPYGAGSSFYNSKDSSCILAKEDADIGDSESAEKADIDGEALLDAFVVLYDDCNSRDTVKKPVKYFLEKFESAVGQVKTMRVNVTDFEVGDVVGRGRFSNVRLIREKVIRRIYALKTMNKFDGEVQKHLALVDAEIAVLSKNASKWIVQLKYSFQDPTKLYFVMEYLPGGDLRSLMQRFHGKLNMEMARFYLGELVLAIHAVHTLGFVHRDVTPENILLDQAGHLKLIDFGSSSKLKNDGTVSTPLFNLGSVTYVAPEVLRNVEDGDGEKGVRFSYGAECDFWSLGVIAYEVIFGKVPFDSDEVIGIYNQIVSFKFQLSIPEGEMYEDLGHLLRGLLTVSKERLNYDDCLRHPFFNAVMWDGLRDELPPFIPEIKPEENLKFAGSDALQKSTGTTPRLDERILDLPFVGFTRCYFNPPKTSMDNSSYAESTDGSFMYGEFKDDVTVKLQAEVTGKTQALDERNKKIEELQGLLKERDAVISGMETEKAKMLGEVKQLKVEKQQLNSNLAEELEVRKQIQNQSQKLVVDIKNSCQNRIAKLKEDLKMKEELNENKQSLIKELDLVVRQLRCEIQRLNGELQSAKGKEGEIQGRLSKSYRGSISMMETELSRKSSELEFQVKQIEAKYANEIYTKIKEYENVVDDLKQSLNEKTNELEEVKGRLEESRQAREATLEEMRLSRKKYTQSIQELEKKFDDSHEQILVLQKEVEKDNSSRQQVQELEGQLFQCRKTNDVLTARVDLAERDVGVKDSKIAEMESKIIRLKQSMENLEAQKRELNETTQECIRKTMEISAQKIMQEQLDRCQATCDATKETLMEERLRKRELQEKFAELDKQYGLAKVDVRIFSREKRVAEEKCEKLVKECAKLSEQLEHSQNTITELRKSISDAEKALSSLKTKSVEDTYDLTQAQQMYEDAKTEKYQLEMNVKELKDEIIGLKEKLEHYDKLRVGLTERDSLLNEKDQQLEEKKRNIETLQMNILVLKETTTVLDNQLRDFEVAFTNKVKELQASEELRSQMESECSLLKENLKKTRIDLNEAKSLKTFVEKRLNEVEGTQKVEELRVSSDMKSLLGQVEQLKRKNEELSAALNNVTAELENVKTEKDHLEQLFEKGRQDNAKFNEEISRTLNMVVTLKDQNIKLKSGLEEALVKAETFKNRSEQLATDHEVLELERYEKEVQLQSTIKQQAKLIEHLQDQNEALGKKKDKKFHLFSRVKEEKECTPRPVGPNSHTLKYTSTPNGNRSTPATPAATPVRLFQEHRAVINLEEKAASLKQQLALLQDTKEVKTQKDPSLPTPKKEECVMLHKKHSTVRKAPKSYDNTHQFLDRTMMKTEKCWRCIEPIYFGRIASVCTTCTAMFHVKCGTAAGDSCGLPKDAIIELEKRSLLQCPDTEFMTEDEDDEFIEGWVQIIGEKGLEKQHARLFDGKLVFCEDSSPSAQVLQKFPLNEKTRVELRVNKTDLKIPVEQDKLPFMLKVVTPSDNGIHAWDGNKYLYIITDSSNQKRFWTRAIFKNSAHMGSSSTIDSAELLEFQSGMSSLSGMRKFLLFRDSDDRLDINCVYRVSNDLYLMGCEEGLYSRRVVSSQPSTKVKIEGVEAIFQIEFISNLNSVVMIEGSDRRLVIAHMGIVRVCAEAAACSKPKLTTNPVAEIRNCHLFQHIAGDNGEIYLTVATPKHLHILCWKGESFVTLKRINTRETVTCMLMNPNSVIFGCDRVYELDIKNFQLEDFVDNSDDTLYYLRFSCETFSSFPVAILDVSMSNWNPEQNSFAKEYLLCFSDMGVFVDAYGRRSRAEDIVWSKLPVAVAYRHPNLFVLHFASIEIIRLRHDSYTRTRVIESKDSIGQEYSVVPESRFLPLISPRFLGHGGKTASIVVSSVEKHKTEVIEVDVDGLST